MKKIIILMIFFVVGGAGCTKQETKPTIQTQNNTIKQEQVVKTPEQLEEEKRQKRIQRMIDEGIPTEIKMINLTEKEKGGVDPTNITIEEITEEEITEEEITEEEILIEE